MASSNSNYKGQAIYEYNDNTNVVIYGYIIILSINLNQINFNYTLYNSSGALLKNNSVTVNVGSNVDLDGDGKADVEYVTQINSVRPTNSTTRYLRFITNQTQLMDNAYCYIPEYLSTENSANGNLGFNENGNAIIKPLTKTALAKTAVTAGMDIQIGDFIMDTDIGTYLQISQSTSALAKSAITMDQLVSYSTPVDNLGSVFSIIHMSSSQTNFALQKSSASLPINGYQNLSDLVAAEEAENSVIDGYQWFWSFPQFSGMVPVGSTGLSVGLDSVVVRMGFDADFDFTWSRISGKVGAIVMVTCAPTLSVSKDVLGIVSQQNQSITIQMPTFPVASFPLGPLMINLSFAPELGCMLNVNLKPGAKVYSSAFAATGFTTSFSVGWTGVSSPTSNNYTTGGLYTSFDMQTGIGAGAYARPYIGIGPRIDLGPAGDSRTGLYVQLTARKWIGPGWSTTISTANPNFASTTFGFYQGRNFTLQAGASVGITLFGYNFYKPWQAINQSYDEVIDPIFSYTFNTPTYFDPQSNIQYTGVAGTGSIPQISVLVASHVDLPAIYNLLLNN